MRRFLLCAAVAATLALPAGARANHAGCVATATAPRCTYTAIGAHSATGYSQGGFEAWVIRIINDIPTKVVIGSDPDGAVVASPVAAIAGELVTLDLRPGAQGTIGVVSSGNTSGHP